MYFLESLILTIPNNLQYIIHFSIPAKLTWPSLLNITVLSLKVVFPLKSLPPMNRITQFGLN